MGVCCIESNTWFTTECETPFIRRFSAEARKCLAWKHVYATGLLDVGRRVTGHGLRL